MISAQVSLRAKAKPGKGGTGLTPLDFKHTRRLYWSTSRERPKCLWPELLLPSDPAVQAYQSRHKEEYPDQYMLDHSDLFDHFLECFKDKQRRAQLVDSDVCPTTKLLAGEIFECKEKLVDIFQHVMGMSATRTSVHANARVLLCAPS